MKDFLKQFSGLIGAAIAAACCLGIPAVLAGLGAIGLGFIIHDAYLVPLFVGFAAFSAWVLYRSARRRGRLAPFWLALSGAIVGSVSLWLMVTGIYPLPWLVYVSLGALFAGSAWDFVNGRLAASRKAEPARPASGQPSVNMARRVAAGGALAAGAAAAFYGLHKSVAVFAPAAEAGEIACFGINECKGQSACTTAFNACTGQNECKGQGFLNVPEKECAIRGGVPLAGSAADPAKG